MTESDREQLVARLREQTWIDEPFVGFADPSRLQADAPSWPGSAWAHVRRTDGIETDERDVWLYRFVRHDGAEVPVGFVFDKTNEDLRARVYYNKTAFGSDEPRRPLIAPEDSPIAEELARYRDAIRSGDRTRISGVIDPRAELQSPFGTVKGAQVIEAFSDDPAVSVKGVPLQFCTVTREAHRYAVEFISWRRPPHGGLSLYEFTDGKLTNMQIFEGPVRP